MVLLYTQNKRNAIELSVIKKITMLYSEYSKWYNNYVGVLWIKFLYRLAIGLAQCDWNTDWKNERRIDAWKKKVCRVQVHFA